MLSIVIIVFNPNRNLTNVCFKIRKQKPKHPSTVDNEKPKNFPVIIQRGESSLYITLLNKCH